MEKNSKGVAADSRSADFMGIEVIIGLLWAGKYCNIMMERI